MTQENTEIRISEPGELIDTIPYLLGFHPQRSLCLVGFAASADAGRRHVQLAVRVDLPAHDEAGDDIRRLAEALERSGARSAVALIYPPETDGELSAKLGWRWLHELTAHALAAAGVELLDSLVITAEHWWSLCCEDASCCPVDGHKRIVGGTAAAAQAVFAGLVAAADRTEIEACLDGASSAARSSLEPYLAEAENRLMRAMTSNGYRRLIRRDADAVMRAAGRQYRPTAEADDENAGRTALTQRQLARHAVALAEISVRDELWLSIDERGVDATDYLLEMIRRLPSPYDAPALFLFGWHQWRLGNGTLACIAAERALESDPLCSAARLLMTAVQHGLNPMTTPTLRAPMAG